MVATNRSSRSDRFASSVAPDSGPRRRSRPVRWTGILAAAALAIPALPAQFLGPLPTETRAGARPTRPVASALDAARRNLADGDAETARGRLMQVLPRHPASDELLGTILEAALAEGPEAVDLQLMWMHHYAEVLQNKRGKVKWPRSLAKQLPWAAATNKKEIETLATARSDALKALTKHARQLARPRGGDRVAAAMLSARLVAELGWSITRRNPALFASSRGELWPRFAPPIDETLTALRAVMGAGSTGNATAEDPTNGPDLATQLAVRAAFVLRGLGRQAAFEDLRGPKPAARAERDGAAARDFIAAAREKNREAFGPPRTVTELRDMGPATRDVFSARWNDPANPAYALSPNGLYLIETHLGHEVLLTAAEQVEFHHERLAKFYGKDPFRSGEGVKRRGTVRVVPDRAGLESEGSPFWWAGGFQAGHVTTVSFNCSTDEALGRVLTHELTHRFDGTFHPFQPSWLAEGRAVWTGAAYEGIPSKFFIDTYLPISSLAAARTKGYGRAEKLRLLIDGRPPDYRDNYPVGASLYCFLRTWRAGGKEVFAKAFEQWTRNMRRGRGDQRKWFEANFCDGKEGRPENLAGFATMFREFLEGPFLPRRERPRWLDKFATNIRPRGGQRIYEPRSWIDTRSRVEPTFGQDHAGAALEILHEADDLGGAAAAAAWTLASDEWIPERMAVVADTLGRLGKDPGGAWLAARRARNLGGTLLGVATVNAPVEYVQADPYLTLTYPATVPASQPTISIDTAGSHAVFKPAGSPHSPPVTYDYEQINITPIFPTTVTWQQQSGPVGIFDNPNTGSPSSWASG